VSWLAPAGQACRDRGTNPIPLDEAYTKLKALATAAAQLRAEVSAR
jgi:hypothetical protein